MPAEIVVPDGVVEYIRIPVKRGRLPRLGDDAVSLGEVSRQRVIVARDIVVKSQFGLGELAGIPVFGGGGVLGESDLSKSRVLDGTVPASIFVGRGAG